MIKVNEAYTVNRTDETLTALNDCWVLVSRKARSKELHISVANGAEGSKNAVSWMKDNKRVFVTLFNLSRLVSYVDNSAEWGEGAQSLFGKNLVALKKAGIVDMEAVEGLFYKLLRGVVGTFEYNPLSFGSVEVPLLEDADWVDGIVFDYDLETGTFDFTPYIPGEDESIEEEDESVSDDSVDDESDDIVEDETNTDIDTDETDDD